MILRVWHLPWAAAKSKFTFLYLHPITWIMNSSKLKAFRLQLLYCILSFVFLLNNSKYKTFIIIFSTTASQHNIWKFKSIGRKIHKMIISSKIDNYQQMGSCSFVCYIILLGWQWSIGFTSNIYQKIKFTDSLYIKSVHHVILSKQKIITQCWLFCCRMSIYSCWPAYMVCWEYTQKLNVEQQV